MKRIFVAAAFAILLVATHSAQADILALYEFHFDNQFDSNGDEISGTTDTHPFSSSTDSSTNSSSLGNLYSGVSSGNHGYMSAMNTPVHANPSTNTHFHDFSTTINSGNWNIDAITFDYWINSAPAGGLYTATVFSDRTGLSSPSDALGSFSYSTSGGNTGIQTVTMNFANNPLLQNLKAGDMTTFRMVFSDNQSGGTVHRVDDVEIRGYLSQANVPEPAAASIIGGLAMAFCVRRRRRN